MPWQFTTTDAIGAIGMTLLFIAFVLTELEIINDRKYSFNLLNGLGSLILWWYAYTLETLIFLILNTFWIVISFAKIVKLVVSKNKSF